MKSVRKIFGGLCLIALVLLNVGSANPAKKSGPSDGAVTIYLSNYGLSVTSGIWDGSPTEKRCYDQHSHGVSVYHDGSSVIITYNENGF